MASNIDATMPVHGVPTTQSVRDNFAVAKAEIEALQGVSGNVGFINVTDAPYGAKCDGATDDTAAVNAALAHAASIGGGIIRFPHGTCLLLAAIVVPYTGTNNPIQAPLRLTGAGGNPDSYLGNSQFGPSIPPGGTILDMRYAGGGAAVAKIDTRGAGVLEIDHLTIIDGTPHASYSNTLFIQTTNTTLLIHDCRFRGDMSAPGTACLQDCIRLGAIASGGALGTNAATAGFQGYGSKIENNQFDYIREGVQFGIAANSVFLANNMFTVNCGSGLAIGGAYHFYGVDYACGGNTIYGGVVELAHYPYGVVLTTLGSDGFNKQNVFDSMGLYDENMGAPTLGGFYFDANSIYNTIYSGFSDQPLQNGPLVQGPGAQQNTVINSLGLSRVSLALTIGQDTYDGMLNVDGSNAADGGSLITFRNAGTPVAYLGNYSRVEGGPYDPRFVIYAGSHGVILPSDPLFLSAGALVVGTAAVGSPSITVNGAASGPNAGPSLIFQWGGTQRGGVQGYSAFFGGTYDSRVFVHGFDGLVFGTANAVAGGFDSSHNFSAVGSVGCGGAGGPTWTTGTAAPSSVQPIGSFYSRTGGAVGATIYVSRGGGTWAAIAGV